MHGFMVKVMGAGLVPVATRTFKYENLARAEFERECEDERFTVVLFDTDEDNCWRSVHKREGEYTTMWKQLCEKYHDMDALAFDASWENYEYRYYLWVRVSDYIGRTIWEGHFDPKMAEVLVDYMLAHPNERGYRYNSEIRKEKLEVE